MRQLTIKIAPGAAYELNFVGDYVRVKSSAVVLTIESPDHNELVEAAEGEDYEFSPFSRLRISHVDAAEQTVKLVLSRGKKANSAKVSGSVTVSGSVEVANDVGNPLPVSIPAGVVVTNLAGAPVPVSVQNKDALQGAFSQGSLSVTNVSATIMAPLAGRRYLMIQNNSQISALRLTLDGSAPTATHGFRVQPGQTFEVPNYCVSGPVGGIMETADATVNNVEYMYG